MKAILAQPITKSAASDFQRLLEDKQFLTLPKVGDIVKGRALSVSKTEVHLDIGGYASGVVRGRELYNESAEYGDLKIGDETEATVIELENELGELELSFRFAGQRKSWDNINTLKDDSSMVEVEVVEANKGGLLVRMGHVVGFLPVSQLLPEHYPRVPGGDKTKIQDQLKAYIGQHLKVKVLDVSPDDDKLIFSEKKIVEDEQLSRISSHGVGEVHEGPITAITDFGAFMEFNEGLTGLIHISELAWQRVDHPTDVVKIGDIVKAEIININGSKVFLSRKRLVLDPWKMVEEKYHIGDVVKGRVLKINPFGLFVELDSDIHGLAHISELEAADITGGIKVGDIAEFKIISLKPNEHRLGLSLKALKGNVSAPDPQASISSPDSAEVIAVPIKEETSLLAPETSDQSKDATQ
ncbi:hypothetical protein A3H10_00885 [Candidatus Uhrbacteria bacterium RIFCSPLOWO2_12_FULL_46_10]|uniref:S1 motif domain-containing protein n=1 Tax=Candidatus Uhrbacteria bacterium RIFCSPLOWO2_01_FULL_47_25 TaxID=1802402 RepID=A0A1F7UTP7_9BACT|nr:MAG: hypothetical protein A2752_01150 [Candidatus Uhrbacteria bacterium RIFCSPHIGHO2_01_FULL_46_23]OGL68494.1 MAG: hypothetical protein A3D60_02665 [Candidatus Uhrbacteria bacterium RIFCSPHIGHO2_02_FULL_47_29]OGL75579.1 MAG: hypothetical protein A3E96_00870 [Candidatus Uhrbacteria bacterium RIFCSPHIGHO2_12_FULL_46_13]OGL81094.1 MAG: hypothetical protein A2936_00635 [Candidatus Uhrbacteria bacterium RIFCSPLOWO2_01_FULL_47_25]OGL86407.1 MAG: hypothetical protein A3I37_01910 [Candidatus Uhrbact